MSLPMHLYQFGNRIITCAFPLPSLRPASASAVASLHIAAPTMVERLTERDTWWHQWSDKQGSIFLRLALDENKDEPRTYLLQISDLCEVRLDPAHGSISIAHPPGMGSEAIEHLLIDMVLPCLLAELGELVVHAACVSQGAECVLFLGQSGWGKSTLTSLLRRHGYASMSDDCVQLTIHDGHVLATPTYPSLRLFDDSVEQTFEHVPILHPVAHYTRKRRIRFDADTASQENPIPASAIYLLNDPAQPATDISIAPIPGIAAYMALIAHGFRLDLRTRQSHDSFMQQAAEAARRLPAFSLRYPRDFTQTERLITELTRHFATLPTTGDTPATDAPPAREWR